MYVSLSGIFVVVLLMPYIFFQDGSYMPFLIEMDLNNGGSSVFVLYSRCFDS